MIDKLKYIKLELEDGSYSEPIPISAEAEYVDTSDGESVEEKLNKKPYYFNNVAEMKSNNKLKSGDLVTTLGYYAANDGGNASYLVRNKTQGDVQDNGSIHFLNNNLVAELVIENDIVNVKCFGPKINILYDSTEKLQNAIDYAVLNGIKNIYLPCGTYYISKIKIANKVATANSINLYGENMYNTILNSIASNINNTGLIDFSNCMQCSIHDIGLRGNKGNNSNVFDGLYVNSSERMTGVSLYNITCMHFTGNGFYINSQNHYIMDTYMDNCVIALNNENGLYMDRMTDSKISNCTFYQNKKNGVVVSQSSNHFLNCKSYLNGIYDGVTTDSTITPEGAQHDYLKRYSGYLIHSGRNVLTGCEAQENYGHGFVIQQCSNNILVGCSADGNGICGFDNQGNRITRANYDEEAVYSGFYVDRCAYTLIEGIVQNFIQSSQGASQKYALTILTSSNTNANLVVSDTEELYHLENVSFKSTHLTFNNRVYDVQEIPLEDALSINISGATATNRSHVYLKNNNELIYNIVLTLTNNLESNNSISVLTFKSGYRPKNAYQNGYLAVSANQYSNQSPHYNEVSTAGILATSNNEADKKAITLNGKFFIN